MDKLIRLENRSVIEISGSDAHDFLQGIITNDIDAIEDGRALYAGLLTPQGKLLFDFFIVKHDNSYLLDVDSRLVKDLIQRLMFYKLRADVEIALLGQAVICVCLGKYTNSGNNAVHFEDPRTSKMGSRLILLEPPVQSCKASPDSWHAHRIELGIPEAGLDYTHGACFPHDIAMDQLGGIGFKKGCYVGQEVVSRMQHRGTARKRPMIVRSVSDLPASSSKIDSDGKVLGQLGSVSGSIGLAEIRLDRATKALNEGTGFTIAGVEVELLRPIWAEYGELFKTMADNGGTR